MIYLTRDADEDGVLDDMIDVWSHEPIRHDNGKAVVWRAGRKDYTLLKILYVKDAKKAFKIVPLAAKEMIVVVRKEKGIEN